MLFQRLNCHPRKYGAKRDDVPASDGSKVIGEQWLGRRVPTAC